jgi:hypothetical protein
VIALRAASFASRVAGRYAGASPRIPAPGRVLLQRARGVAAPSRRRPPHTLEPRVILRLTHRVIIAEGAPRGETLRRDLRERVERHVVATHRLVERTRRVEQVPMHTAALTEAGRAVAAHPATLAPPSIVVPALPRVLRRAAPAPDSPTEPAVPRGSSSHRHAMPGAPTGVDVARLTDEVMRGIDRRLAAWRERRGKV